MWHLFQLKNIARYFFRCVSLRFREITFANNNNNSKQGTQVALFAIIIIQLIWSEKLKKKNRHLSPFSTSLLIFNWNGKAWYVCLRSKIKKAYFGDRSGELKTQVRWNTGCCAI